MMKKKLSDFYITTQSRLAFLQLTTALAVFILRLGVLPPNVSPLGSFGFFGKSPLLFLGVILVFDYFVGGHYPGYLFTYLGFAMYPLLSRYTHSSVKRQVLFLPLASFLFFLFSNFGVWLHWYPHTFEGLIQCFTLALPFYRNTLLGDLVFGWGYLVVHRVFPIKKVLLIPQAYI